MEKQTLSIYTLYKSPKDYPGKLVVRRWETDQSTKDVWVVDSVEELLAQLPPGLFWMDRHEHDDPVIVGTWI